MSGMPTRLSKWHLAANDWQAKRATWTIKDMMAELDMNQDIAYYVCCVLMGFGLTEVYGKQGRFNEKIYRATGKEVTEDMRVPPTQGRKRRRTNDGWVALWNAMACGKAGKGRRKSSRVHYLWDEEETA